jgi:hypothetical protein
MFIRWQSRERSWPQFGVWHDENGERRPDDTHHRAILVEAVRVNGKPVQRHIAYLGGITESAISVPVQRCYFWDHITDQFDKLGKKISPADRKRLEKAIAAKVPRPTAKQYKDTARETVRTLGWGKFLHKGFKAVLADEADQWQGHKGTAFEGIKSALDKINAPAATPVATCAFCGKTSEQVQVMVEAASKSGFAICDVCVAEVADIVAKKKTESSSV